MRPPQTTWGHLVRMLEPHSSGTTVTTTEANEDSTPPVELGIHLNNAERLHHSSITVPLPLLER